MENATIRLKQPSNEEEPLLPEDISIFFLVLGKLFYEYPKYEIFEKIAEIDFFKDIPAVFENDEFKSGIQLLKKWNDNGFNEEVFDKIIADYVRLFIGGGDAILSPPWESVYVSEDPMLFQQSTLDVRKLYAKKGLQTERMYSEPDDHIGLELIFLSILQKEAATGDEAKVKDLRDFFTQHPAAWAGHFCDIVAEESQTEFFKGLAKVTKGALKGFGESMGIDLAPKVYR